MTKSIVLILIFSGISLVLILKNYDFPKLEKVIRKISFYSLIGILICVLLLVFDMRLKGKYTTSIIGMTFLLSTILLFGLTKKKSTKLLSGILTIPMFVFGILSLIWETPLLFFYLIALPFKQPIAKFNIDNNHQIEFHTTEIGPQNESLRITESVLGIFDKEKFKGIFDNATKINKVDTLEFNNDKAVFLIFYDGNETEKYVANLKNVW